MKRCFTLRITAEESDQLDRIKQILGENTDTGAIRNLISSYEELSNRYNAEIAKNGRLDHNYRELKEKVDFFLSAFNNLKV